MSDLRVAFLGVTRARLTWSNANGTASYRMLIEESASSVNVSDLKPGTHNISVFPEANKTQNNFLVADNVLGELRNCISGFDFHHLLVLKSTCARICVGL